MTRETAQFTLEAGCLMTSFDWYLTRSDDGFFFNYGRRALGIDPATGDIGPDAIHTFFPEVTARALSRGIPEDVISGLRKEAAEKAQQLMETPGALEMLRAMQATVNRACNARRKARDN